jgi:hypothetical protein
MRFVSCSGEQSRPGISRGRRDLGDVRFVEASNGGRDDLLSLL